MAKSKGKGKDGSKTGQPKVTNAVKQQAPSETQKALSIVEQGPRDNTVREDGYGGNVGSGSTSFYSSISNYTDDFFNSFKGKGGLIPDFKSFNLTSLAGIKDAFNKVAHLDVNKIKSDFEHSVLGGRSIESIMALPKKLKENPFGTVEEFFGAKSIGGVNVGEWAKKAGMSYKEALGMYNMVKNNDWTSFQGIMNGLEVIGRTELASPLGKLVNGFIDITATSAFLGSLAREAVKLGNQPLVKEVMKYFKDKRHGKKHLNAAMYGAAVASDMANMDYILEYVGSDETRSNNPILIRWILQHYSLDGLYRADKIDEYRDRLINLLNKVDPEWYYEMRDGEKVTKLEPFLWATHDAIKLFLHQPANGDKTYDFQTEIMIAKVYPVQDIKQMIMRQYSEIAYKDRPLDPRKKR